MKARGLVVLAVVAAVLGGVLFVDLRHRPSNGDERAGARERLLPLFDRKAVHRIVIRRRDAKPFSLLQAPSPGAPASGWRLEAADAQFADEAAIADLLAAIDLAESDRIASISPEAAGLQPPAVEVDVETTTGVLSAQLGRSDAAGRGVYARAGTQGPIRVVSHRLLEVVDRKPEAFRDRRVFPVDPAAVTSIVWRDKGGAHELRAVDGRWQNGRKDWVEEGRVVEALRRLSALRIEEFHSDVTSGDRRLTLTAGTARVSIEGGEQGTLDRGAEGLRVRAEALESVWRALASAEVRDTRLIALAPDAITRIDLFDDHGRVGLRRVSGAWTFATPKVSYDVDTRAVDDWLARLGAVTTTTRAAGSDTRHLILEGRFRQEIKVSSPPDVFGLLAPDPLRFRERALLSFARFDVRRLQRAAGKNVATVTSDDGSSWQTPSGGQADAASVARIVGALSELRAEDFSAGAPAGEPAVRLEVDVQAPGEAKPARHTLQIWPTCGARLDADATFKIERASCDALQSDLLKKAD